jgi:hypothetical protein
MSNEFELVLESGVIKLCRFLKALDINVALFGESLGITKIERTPFSILVVDDVNIIVGAVHRLL